MKKQKRGIKVEPDYKSMKLVGFGILAVVCLLFARFMTGCSTPPDNGGVISVIQSLPIEQAKIYYDLYDEAETLEEKREVMVMLRTDVDGGPFAIIIPRVDEEIARINRQIEIRDMPTPTPPPAVTPKPDGGNDIPIGGGSGGFLWKPDSESTGKLAILLPGKLHGRTKGTATISGSFGSESAPLRGEEHNGGRPHFYFSKPGAAYGNNITVTAPLTDGSVYTTVVPNGSQRHE